MKLDRNGPAGSGKYAVVKLRRLPSQGDAKHSEALNLLLAGGFVTLGYPGSEDEFFVVMLKDRYADEALNAYAQAAADDGEGEYAAEVRVLAQRSGRHHPNSKKPD